MLISVLFSYLIFSLYHGHFIHNDLRILAFRWFIPYYHWLPFKLCKTLNAYPYDRKSDIFWDLSFSLPYHPEKVIFQILIILRNILSDFCIMWVRISKWHWLYSKATMKGCFEIIYVLNVSLNNQYNTNECNYRALNYK